MRMKLKLFDILTIKGYDHVFHQEHYEYERPKYSLLSLFGNKEMEKVIVPEKYIQYEKTYRVPVIFAKPFIFALKFMFDFIEIETKELPDDELLLQTRKVIRGDYGNGIDREIELGLYYDQIMFQVNKNLRDNNITWDGIKLYK